MTTRALADHLDRCLAEGTTLDNEALAHALRTAPDPEALHSWARFAEESYVRVPILRNDRYEVRLLCWQRNQSSALHGHGGSACAFRVISGEATELRADGSVTPLPLGAVGTADQGVIHQVGNLAESPLLTLHIYAPPLPVDQPSPADGRQVVILGGGWSGTALAIHLLASQDPGLRVTLVEGGPEVGRGVAYGTEDHGHILNVAAIGMTLDPAQPSDFVDFARSRGVDATADSLLSRRLYGSYVQDRLARAITTSPSKLRFARSIATRVSAQGRRWQVDLADGRRLEADEVVLATGHGPSKVPPAFAALTTDPRLVVDPWTPGALAAVAPDERVLVIGTGLTAVDVLQTLRRQGHATPVHAASRHGRWPRPHLPNVRWTGAKVDLDIASAPRTADGLAAWLRLQIHNAEDRDIPWQAVLETLRPSVSTLWGRLDETERARFLGEHRADWEIARHRIPVASHDALRAWQEEGWLVTHRGGAPTVLATAAGLEVSLDTGSAAFDRVILCTGQESDPRTFASALWEDLLGAGLVAADVHGLGVLTDDRGATLRADGVPTGLWALGGLQRPRWFESTAVPVLSGQVAALARVLAPFRGPTHDGFVAGVQP